MSDHLSKENIERYQQHLMEPLELLAASDHIAGCGICRQHLNSGNRLKTAVESLQDYLQTTQPNHLLYEQLADYVDNDLGEVDLEIIESHLQLCEQCRAEVDDLRAFKTSDVIHSQKGRAVPPALHIKDKLTTFWKNPVYPITLLIIWTAVAVLLSWWVATLALRKEITGLQSQVSELQRTNSELESQVATIAELQNQLQQSQTPVTPSKFSDVIYDAGDVIALDEQGGIIGLDSIPSPYQQIVKTALMTGRVEMPEEVKRLREGAGTLRGASSEGNPFTVIRPTGTVIQTTTPTFKWHPLSGASSYTVSIYDSNYKKVATSQDIKTTQWTVSPPLEPDRVYSWKVTAIREGKEITTPAPPAPESKFKVLDQTRANELKHLKQTYASSHLLLGILYKQSGLLEDALRELKLLAARNPKSKITQKLLSDARAAGLKD